ncbi:MAG: protein BatD, partial [Elusimicrobia bacterium]|nr:protein BatD [Elusimicrobiota bacterium]
MGQATRDRGQGKKGRKRLSFFSHLFSLLCFFVVPCSLSLVPFSFADEISFTAEVDPARLTLGTAGHLILTVQGAQNLEPPRIPPIDGFETRYIGPSTQIRVVNGTYSSSQAFTYLLIPLKEGKFTIPSFDLTVQGQDYQTRALVVDVGPAAADGGEASGQDDPATLADQIRMVIVPAKAGCFVNEEVPVTVKLYVGKVQLKNISLPEIRQTGFALSGDPEIRQYQEVLGGQAYQVVEFRTVMTPLKAGDISLGPAVVSADLLLKTASRRSPFSGSVFDDEFFSSFFGNYQARRISITAPSVAMRVRDLPVEGAPQGFSGAVGRFTMDAVLSPSEVKVGDPLTLRVTVMGAGNMTPVALSPIQSSDFKMYDPQVTQE